MELSFWSIFVRKGINFEVLFCIYLSIYQSVLFCIYLSIYLSLILLFKKKITVAIQNISIKRIFSGRNLRRENAKKKPNNKKNLNNCIPLNKR